MLTRRFEELLPQLLEAFVAYDDVPRTPDHVCELAAARAALDDLRSAIAEERDWSERWIDCVERLRRTEVDDGSIILLRAHGVLHD